MRGLGDLLKAGLGRLGIPSCGGCDRRAMRLNRWTPGYRELRQAPRPVNARRMFLSLRDKIQRPLEQGHQRRVSFPGHRTVGHFPFSSYGASGGSATERANDLSDAEVQAAFNRIASDTIECLLPAGSAHWAQSKTLTLPAGIQDFALKAAGSESGITGGGDATTIIDDSTDDNQLITVDATTHAVNRTMRIAGFTLLWNINFAHIHGQGFIKYIGLNQLRVDHNTFRQINGPFYSIYLYGPTGVFDHNLADVGITAARSVGGAGTFDSYGDAMWNKPTNFGGSDWFFIEDNQIATVADVGGASGIIADCYAGSKLVIRYNQALESVETHGLDQDHGRLRGCRALEVYNNTFTSTLPPPRFQAVDINNGPNLVWGNTLAVAYSNFLSLRAHRSNDDGTDWPPRIWPDGHLVTNAPVSDGDWGYCGTAFSGTGSSIDGNTDPVTGYPCLDQIGRGRGDLLQNPFLTGQSGTQPTIVNVTRGCDSSQACINPRQDMEPVYEWLTSGFGGAASDRVKLWQGIVIGDNRDVYSDRGAAFNGTVGVGSGPKSRILPGGDLTQCNPLVAYWAIDEQKLYQCAQANTWTFFYAPYFYPHPLVTGPGGTPPAPPSNLRFG